MCNCAYFEIVRVVLIFIFNLRLNGTFHVYFQDIHSNPRQARDYINKWVSRVTKNNIENLLPEDGIGENTKLVLANAAYFKGVWASKFPAERTKKEIFYVSETRQTLVPFMKQKGTFHYSKYLTYFCSL